MRMIRRYLKLQ